MATVDIRRCRAGEVDALMRFIDEHWQRGHVLGVHRPLLDWQHRAIDGDYDYLVAFEGDRLLGVLGYIATSRFDPALGVREVVWLALWKVREGAPPALGLRLLRVLEQVHPHAAVAVNGINLSHPPMYRALGYRVSELAQHVLLDPDAEQTLIANAPALRAPRPSGTATRFVELGAADLDALPSRVAQGDAAPAKTPIYFRERFLRHPFYRYRVFLAESDGGGGGLLALRVAEHEGRRAVRIVDFAGDAALLGSCGVGVQQIVARLEAEYADVWSWGVEDGLLAASGFARVDPDGKATVPNYFEPFLARNARILCAVRSRSEQPWRVFRADGDQDRPNRLGGTR
jgi:hypothetical protein